MIKTFHHKITEKSNVGRLDQVLAQQVALGLSKRKIRHLIDIGGVFINRKRVRIASRQVNVGDLILVEYSDETLQKSGVQKVALSSADILYADSRLIALNKPPGLNAHATRLQAVAHAGQSLKDFYKEKGEPLAALYLVHRLDRETSGIMLFARDPQMADNLITQFKDRLVTKVYWALCWGLPDKSDFEMQCFLSDIDKNTGQVRIVDNPAEGKEAHTRFRCLKQNIKRGISLIECFPQTGRSHQIRIQLSALGFPIVGDKKYDRFARRQSDPQIKLLSQEHHLLHARQIAFKGPQGVMMQIEAAPPENFQKVLDLLDADQG